MLPVPTKIPSRAQLHHNNEQGLKLNFVTFCYTVSPGWALGATQHSTPGQHSKEWNWVTLKYPQPKYIQLIRLTTKRPNAYSKIFSSRLCLPERHKHNVMCWLCMCLVSAMSDIPKAQLYGRLVCQVPALVTFINANVTLYNFLQANMQSVYFFYKDFLLHRVNIC